MTSGALRGARVMVVDDLADNVTIVVRGLQQHGALPLAFTEPRRALAAARAQAPDALVVDLAMPGLDGAELTRTLLAEPGLANLPVVVLTASDDPADVDRAFAAGASDYVTKPVRLAELVARLGVHVERERQRLELDRVARALREAEQVRASVEAIVQHDLKAPLASILGLTSLLRDTELDVATQQELLARVQTAGRRMLAQLERSLELFRVEQGLHVPPSTVLDVVAVVDEVVQGLVGGEVGDAPDVRVTVVPERPVLAEGDDGLVHSALGNLLRNAVEAASGRPVDVSVTRDRDSVVVAVGNDGEVPPAVRDRFFDKYVTAGKARGTGLGTYSARTMVRACGGEVVLLDAPPGRTVVEVRLAASPV